jgi:acetophenone carboxylase
MRVRITEYLDVALDARRWVCNRCSHDLGPANRPYKEGCLIRDRNPQEVHPPFGLDPEYNYSFDPEWVRLIEFYCPGCLTLLETEYLPPGHPLTWDIELDLDSLAARHAKGTNP